MMTRHLNLMRVAGRAGLALALLVVGCSGPRTSVTQTWRATGAETQGPMRTLLVLGARMDETHRRVFEDAVVKRLAAHGVSARPSYEVFPGALPDAETARATATRARFDGILVGTHLGTREIESYVPPTTVGSFWGSYYGAWGPMGMHHSPGYMVPQQITNGEVTLWDARVGGGQLVWSAATRTTDATPKGDADIPKSVLDEVLPEIAKAGLIPPERD